MLEAQSVAGAPLKRAIAPSQKSLKACFTRSLKGKQWQTSRKRQRRALENIFQ